MDVMVILEPKLHYDNPTGRSGLVAEHHQITAAACASVAAAGACTPCLQSQIRNSVEFQAAIPKRFIYCPFKSRTLPTTIPGIVFGTRAAYAPLGIHTSKPCNLSNMFPLRKVWKHNVTNR